MTTMGPSFETTGAATPSEPVEEKRAGQAAAGEGGALLTDEKSAEEKNSRKRAPLIAIPILLSVGLLVATGYVGHRIFVARFHATPPAQSPAPASLASAENFRVDGAVPNDPAAVPKGNQASTPKPEVKAVEPASAVVRKAADKPEAKQAEAASPAVIAPAVKQPGGKRIEPASGAARRAADAPADAASSSVERVTTAAARPEAKPAQPASSDELLVPKPGERYLQVLAANSKFVPRILADLRRSHLDVHVAPGPQEDLRRFLVGPFPDDEALLRAKAQIQTLHPDCFVRAY